MLTEEQAKKEMTALKDFLKDERKLDFRDSVFLLLNTLVWFGVSIETIEEYTDKIEKVQRRPGIG